MWIYREDNVAESAYRCASRQERSRERRGVLASNRLVCDLACAACSACLLARLVLLLLLLLKQLIRLLVRLLEAVELEELAVAAGPPLRAVLLRALHERVGGLQQQQQQGREMTAQQAHTQQQHGRSEQRRDEHKGPRYHPCCRSRGHSDRCPRPKFSASLFCAPRTW